MPDFIWTDAGMRGKLPQEYVEQLSADQKELRAWLVGDFDGLKPVPPVGRLYFGARAGGKAVNPHAKMHAPIVTNPIPCAVCTLGVGCEEAGMCYAFAHGRPDQCGLCDPWDNWKPARDLW